MSPIRIPSEARSGIAGQNLANGRKSHTADGTPDLAPPQIRLYFRSENGMPGEPRRNERPGIEIVFTSSGCYNP